MNKQIPKEHILERKDIEDVRPFPPKLWLSHRCYLPFFIIISLINNLSSLIAFIINNIFYK